MQAAVAAPPASSFRSAFVVVSLLLHLVLFWSLSSASRRPVPVQRKPVAVRVIKEKPAEPPPAPPQKPIEVTKKTQVVKKVESLPPPSAPPPKNDEPPPPPVFGLSLSSTGSGSFQAPVGNTTLTDPGNRAPPSQVRPLTGTGDGRAPVSVTQVSKLPEPQGNCPPGNPRELYSQEALEQGIEGKVVLEALIGEDGRVKKASVVRGLGHGLDQAAVKALIDQCRFSPAEMNGEKVPTTIRYTFTFVLEE